MLVAIKLIPSIAILVLITIIPVSKNIKAFIEKPVKSGTFVLSVKNFILINISIVLCIGMTILINS